MYPTINFNSEDKPRTEIIKEFKLIKAYTSNDDIIKRTFELLIPKKQFKKFQERLFTLCEFYGIVIKDIR